VCYVSIVYDVAGIKHYVVMIILDKHEARKNTLIFTMLNIHIVFLWVMLDGYGRLGVK
jgi:hypothetical protein